MSSPLSRRITSDIWYHFSKSDKKGKCRYCQQMISCSSGSTSNLKRHLKLKHPTVSLERSQRSRSPITCGELSKESGDIFVVETTTPSTSTSDSSMAQTTRPITSGSGTSSQISTSEPQCSFMTPSPQTSLRVQQPISKFVNIIKPMTLNKSIALDTQLLKMICKEYHPFSVVEDPEFKKFINMLCPNYSLPSRKTLANSLMPRLHKELFDKINYNLSSAKSICLTSDGWTSMNNISFYALTAHFIDDEINLKSHLLECSEFPERHTSENISAWVTSVITKFKIQNKISALVTDNASNMKSTAIRLNIPHISCFAHSLNLVFQRAIKLSIQKLVDEVKHIVMYFKKSSFALHKLTEMQENLKKDKLKLKQDVPTRWNSTYDMIKRFHLNKEPIISSLAILGAKSCKLNFNDSDWDILDQSTIILKVFDEVTKEISTEQSVSLSKMFVLSQLISRQLRVYKNQNKDCVPEIRMLIDELLKGLTERFGNLTKNDLISQSTLLDPRFKRQGFEEETYKACYDSLLLELEAILEQKTTYQTPREEPIASSTGSSIWEEFDATKDQMKKSHEPGAAAIMELDKYLSEGYLSRNSNPLAWWKTRKLLYPTLFQIVLKRLCIPATSVPCERIFSKAGQVCTEKRSRLTSNKISQILFLNHNMDTLLD